MFGSCLLPLLPLLSLSSGLEILNYGPEPGISVTACEDELPQCAKWAERGLCQGRRNDTEDHGVIDDETYTRAARMLAQCRVSCRRHLLDRAEDISDSDKHVVNTAGGVGDVVKDYFGASYSLCDLSEGFHLEARLNLLNAHLVSFRMSDPNDPRRPRRFTKGGFKKTKVPKVIFGDIVDFYKMKLKIGVFPREKCHPGSSPCQSVLDDGLECSIANRTSQVLLQLPEAMAKTIAAKLQASAEKWSGVSLRPSIVYGIRRYLRGSWLISHTDHAGTHVISAILNVGQSVDEPWPLQIVDHDGKHHDVFLKPGEMVWYESARIKKLNGDYFDNVFAHFAPVV